MARRHFDHEVASTIKLLVPCQFGPGGKHPVSITTNRDGHVLGVRCGCDDLPDEVEKVGAALAGNEHACCRMLFRDMRLLFEDAQSQKYWRAYGTATDLFRKRWTRVTRTLGEVVAREWYDSSHTRNKQVRRQDTPNERVEVFARWARQMENATEIPVDFRVELIDGKKHLTVRETGAPLKPPPLAVYYGGGVWKMGDPVLLERASMRHGGKHGQEGKSRCAVCERSLMNFDNHTKTPRHREKLLSKFQERLATIGEELSRTQKPKAG